MTTVPPVRYTAVSCPAPIGRTGTEYAVINIPALASPTEYFTAITISMRLRCRCVSTALTAAKIITVTVFLYGTPALAPTVSNANNLAAWSGTDTDVIANRPPSEAIAPFRLLASIVHEIEVAVCVVNTPSLPSTQQYTVDMDKEVSVAAGRLALGTDTKRLFAVIVPNRDPSTDPRAFMEAEGVIKAYSS